MIYLGTSERLHLIAEAVALIDWLIDWLADCMNEIDWIWLIDWLFAVRISWRINNIANYKLNKPTYIHDNTSGNPWWRYKSKNFWSTLVQYTNNQREINVSKILKGYSLGGAGAQTPTSFFWSASLRKMSEKPRRASYKTTTFRLPSSTEVIFTKQSE